MQNIPSRLIAQAVEEIAKLPGIGRKTALRLALHLLREEEQYTQSLANAITQMRSETRYCEDCGNISDGRVCSICANRNRDASVLCVIETVADLFAIENTGQYSGLYHVLGGVISPMNGIGPDDLNIDRLIERSQTGDISEVIFAFSATMEADTTAFYIHKKLKPFDVRVSSIARGVPVGGELEYTDEVTLGRSVAERTTYR